MRDLLDPALSLQGLKIADCAKSVQSPLAVVTKLTLAMLQVPPSLMEERARGIMDALETLPGSSDNDHKKRNMTWTQAAVPHIMRAMIKANGGFGPPDNDAFQSESSVHQWWIPRGKNKKSDSKTQQDLVENTLSAMRDTWNSADKSKQAEYWRAVAALTPVTLTRECEAPTLKRKDPGADDPPADPNPNKKLKTDTKRKCSFQERCRKYISTGECRFFHSEETLEKLKVSRKKYLKLEATDKDKADEWMISKTSGKKPEKKKE